VQHKGRYITAFFGETVAGPHQSRILRGGRGVRSLATTRCFPSER
jgi:hypothetical protein